jgi:DNA repair protein SbcD/Mre11
MTAHRMQGTGGMRLMHVADAHLGASYTGFGRLAPGRAAEVLTAFRRLPDQAAEARVDAVLVAGDLFDGPHIGRSTLTAVRETLKAFVDLCIPVFLVPGNHDALTLRLSPYRELARGARFMVQHGRTGRRRDWPVGDEQGRQLAEKHRTYLLARPRLGAPVTVQTGSGPLHVYGAAYDPAEAPDPLAGFERHEAGGVHVVLLHAYVRGLGRWESARNALTVDTQALKRLDVDYVALGDQHRTLLPEQLDGCPACYPGSFAATDLTEAGPRGYVLVDLEPGGAPRIEHRATSVRPVASVDVDVSGCATDGQVAARAAAVVLDRAIPVVRLVGEPAFPLDPDAVAAALTKRYGHASVSDETGCFSSRRLDELAAADTVVGHVVRMGRDRIAAASSDGERATAERALRMALRALEVA